MILDASERKLNKILADQAGEFYDSFFKKWLRDNHIKMYSTYLLNTFLLKYLLEKQDFEAYDSCIKKYLFWCFKWYC